jgi:DNA polymerase I-like protein with 3'-5' exonuclease and polymerase domains
MIDPDLPLPGFPSLKGQGMISIDCETKDPDLKEKGPGYHRPGCFIAGVAVGTEAGYRAYYPIAHESGPNLPKKKVLSWLQEQMRLPVPKVGAHLLYDLGFLGEEGIKVEGPLYDVQNAEPLLNEDRMSYSLESLSSDYLGVGKVDEELDEFLIKNFGRKNPKGNIWRAPYHVVAPYAHGDVNHPLEIFALQKKELEAQGMWDLFILESKLVPMLLRMRRHGVRVDLSRAEKLLAKFKKDKDELLKEIKRTTGHDVGEHAMDLGALKAIFDDAGVAYAMTPKTGKPSITAGFLESCDAPFAKMIVQARKLDKLCGTFLEGCILDAHVNGRIHCQFNQLKGESGGAVSGRFSSSLPNLQFIPVRTAEGKLIRQMFLADDGTQWWKKDYSQIEFRLVVHDAVELGLPGAQEVADEFKRNPNADFHKAVADLAGIDRGFAKTINFGLIYGEGMPKLCSQLNMTMDEGEAFLSEYHKNVPFVKPLDKNARAVAARTGEMITLLNRRRRFPWVSTNRKTGQMFVTKHRIPGSKRGFLHKALNARVQGSAADVMKKAMVDAWEAGICDVLPIQLTVHDELDGSAEPTREAKQALRELHHIMERTIELKVPLKVDGGEGPNWGECEDVFYEPLASVGRGGDFPDKQKRRRK